MELARQGCGSGKRSFVILETSNLPSHKYLTLIRLKEIDKSSFVRERRPWARARYPNSGLFDPSRVEYRCTEGSRFGEPSVHLYFLLWHIAKQGGAA